MIKSNTLKIFTLLILLLIWFNITIPTAYAQFPERGDALIVDPSNSLEQEDQKRLSEYLGSLPHSYVVVFLERIEGEGTNYTKQLFDHYKLSPNHLLLVVTTDDGQLYHTFGQLAKEEGLSDELILKNKEINYNNYIQDKNYTTGVRALVQSVETELENIKAQRERTLESVVEAVEDTEATSTSRTAPIWIKVIGIMFLLVAAFAVFSFFYRRNIKKQVDKLESWKIQLENRPFTTELSRVKGLKMAGETEQHFEKWRGQWEDILTMTLPAIEETLIDIEDYADRYRFLKAKATLSLTSDRLDDIEKALDQIVFEIDELTSSEKNNREKISELYEEYHELRALLQKNAVGLGVSYPVLHDKFKKASAWFDTFNEAQEGGDYLSANDVLEAIEQVFSQVKIAIEHIPALVKDIEEKIPEQIQEVQLAIEEMREKGYVLQHTEIEAKVEELKKNREVLPFLENGQIEEIRQWVDRMLGEVEGLFSLLEVEVESKGYVFKTLPTLPSLMEEISQQYQKLTKTVEVTKQSYSWETEWEEELTLVAEQYTQLEGLYHHIQNKSEEVDQLYPEIKPQIKLYQEKSNIVKGKLAEIEQIVIGLREDEIKAKEISERLKQTIIKIKVILRKSNLPGVPEYLSTGITMGEESVQELQEQLQLIPLDMGRVQHHVKEAKTQVESISQVAKNVIYQAKKAELYIQHANRHRRYYQEIKVLVEEAELSFRRFQYKEAMEFAEEALDIADKRWREKVEISEEIS
jgi:septation ring formation regulator